MLHIKVGKIYISLAYAYGLFLLAIQMDLILRLQPRVCVWGRVGFLLSKSSHQRSPAKHLCGQNIALRESPERQKVN